jgi:RNA polymerase sigma factor (TIGR02999 family)
VPRSPEQISRLLEDWRQGNQQARDALIPLVYDELRRLARRYLRRERPDHTFQSAALVHEAYLRMAQQDAIPLNNRAHFFAVAAQLMRHILVDHARNRRAAKRGGGDAKLTLDTGIALPSKPDVDLVVLDDALTRLAELDPRQSRIIEMRFFGGLSLEETAAVLDISLATVKREWASARAWMRRELSKDRDA